MLIYKIPPKKFKSIIVDDIEINSTNTNTKYGKSIFDSTFSGTSNTMMGHETGTDMTTGYNNTAIGQQSMYKITGGNNNVAVGRWGLYNIITGVGNVAIGRYAGYTITLGASFNVFMGYNSGNNASQKNDATNCICIGNGTYSDESNKIVIGNSSITKTTFAGASQASFVSDASDLPSAITLVNALKTLCINYKFMASS